LQGKIQQLQVQLRLLRESPGVTEVRQCGFVAGIEMADAETAGEVCRRAREYGLLTRNIRETIALLPPLCTTNEQLERAVLALNSAIREAGRESEGRASARPRHAEACPSEAAANPFMSKP